MTRSLLLGAMLALAGPLGGCAEAVANEDCANTARLNYEQERGRLAAMVRALQASQRGDGLKDRQAFMDLMTAIEANENRYKVAIRNCHARNH